MGGLRYCKGIRIGLPNVLLLILLLLLLLLFYR